ncbi:hypothetical protein UFOVP747_20 [uncultured Caudovirales phage]|uniref:Uncharacterized protein n=1 Tax=uncultured Caudovirales phage TaxID=2100421 RepID=A0A6J5NE72_9CAUD|nr:hypothetical protein UFOVP675_10 [uncultured Caudovirales phage]CAB5225379.1 hypothetical protein UFOVP747_20 [uncultured Caudovirales phage]
MTVLFDAIPAAIAAIGSAASAASGTIGTVASVASAGAGVLSALGGMQQQRQMAAAQEYNARVAEQNAATAFAAGTSQADLIALRNRQQLGQARAAAGASGLDVASGSPLEVMADLAGLGAADVAVARRNAEARFTSGQDEARTRRMEADNSRRMAPINTAASLLGTAAQFGANLGGYRLGRA